MKNRLLVLLLVLAMLAVSGLGIASAQEGTKLKTVSLGLIRLYENPDTAGKYRIVAAGTQAELVGVSEDGAWLEVATPDKPQGWVMASDVLVLNLPLLAPKAMVVTGATGTVGLFAERDFGSDILASLPDGTVATILGTEGSWAYVQTADGMLGWSIASSWEALPDGSGTALVTLDSAPELGIFAEANITSDLVTSVPTDTPVMILGAVEGAWANVLLADGKMGYALAASLTPLPNVKVEAVAGDNAVPAVYDAPDFGGNIVQELDPGMVLTWVAAVDDFWVEVYHPSFGMAYILKTSVSNPYAVATNQTSDAIVRAGPSDTLYNAVTMLPAGSKVVAYGVNAAGDFVQVAVPFDQIEFVRNGLGGWMLTSLFSATDGTSDLDAGMLAVTE